MATVKEIKAELDKRGIKYPKKALKSELELFLAPMTATEVIKNRAGTIAERPDDIPRHKAGTKPDYINPEAGFIDPNANPATQA